MFTGIIESLGEIISLQKEQENLHITVKSSLSESLKIDQSLAHNGVCLTVIACNNQQYTVTAIKETLDKTALKHWKVGTLINLERAMKMNARLDGHIVQGHVDQVGVCRAISSQNGSWLFRFSYDPEPGNMTIEKGSITVNGTSLTVVNSDENQFSVAIIPYTYEHTNFHQLKEGDVVNLEFDVIGKYVARLMGKAK